MRPVCPVKKGLRVLRKDSNLRTRFRKPMLYPLSYGGDGYILPEPRRDVSHVALC